MTTMQRQQGFTLLEMMLAIALFSLLSMSALVVFKGVLKNSEITQRKSSQMIALQRVLTLMERDLTQAVTRIPLSFSTAPGLAEFSSKQGEEGENSYQLMLIRTQWANPEARLPRSTLERVEYRWQDGRLERGNYPTLSSPESAVRRVALLDDVTQLTLRFYSQGVWLGTWQAGGSLPEAVELTLETASFGKVQRIILLAPEIGR